MAGGTTEKCKPLIACWWSTLKVIIVYTLFHGPP